MPSRSSSVVANLADLGITTLATSAYFQPEGEAGATGTDGVQMMGKKSTDSDLMYLAQRNIWQKPVVDVLDEQMLDQYSFLTTSIDAVLKAKLKGNSLILPNLRGDGNETVAIYSDYGGEAPDSKYYTYSFLVCGYNDSFGLPEMVRKVRDKFGLGSKEIGFKDFGFGPMQRALEEYLITVDFFIVGLLVTIVVDKAIPTFFAASGPQIAEVTRLLEREGLGVWKPKTAEKLMRILHPICYFVGLLSKDGHRLFWMTDNDDIAPNSKKHQETLNILHRILPLYTKNSFPVVGGAVPFERDGLGFLDFLSVPDVAAGAVEQYFTRKRNPGEIVVKEGADKVLKWLCHAGVGLKKINLLLEKEAGGISSSEIVFQEKDIDPNVKRVFVPVRF